jgi:uncharacterized alpha-E superfamily protein
MLSRVADTLYWMSRYLERAEHTARVMGVQLNLMLEQDPRSADRTWGRLLAGLGHPDPAHAPVDYFTLAQNYTSQQINSAVTSARENARHVREQISSEMWEQVNRLFHEVKRMEAAGFSAAQPVDFLSFIVENSHQFQGVTDSTMNHGEGWQFIQLGRFLERATATARLLDLWFREAPHRQGGPVEPGEHMEWVGLLRSCTAFEAYCKVYTADLKPGRVAEFLLLNSEFPHSVRFACDQMDQSLEAIHQIGSSKRTQKVAKLAGRLRAGLSFTPLEEIVAGLADFCAQIQQQCARIHAGLYEVYITYPIEDALQA